MLTATDEERKVRRALETLIQSRWLEHYIREEDNGYRLFWTPLGKQRAMLLQHLIRSRSLAGNRETLEAYSARCHQAEATLGTNVSDPEAEFWLLCYREWNEEDTHVLWTMVRLFDQWTPRNPEEFVQGAS